MGSRSFPAALSTETDANGGELLDFCDFYEKSHKSKRTKEWINSECGVLHAEMLRVRDEASQPGVPMTQEAISRIMLGEKKWYLRGFGVGPKLFSSSFKSDVESRSHEVEVQRLKCEIDALREEQQKEREEQQAQREAQQRQIDKFQSILTQLLQDPPPH